MAASPSEVSGHRQLSRQRLLAGRTAPASLNRPDGRARRLHIRKRRNGCRRDAASYAEAVLENLHRFRTTATCQAGCVFPYNTVEFEPCQSTKPRVIGIAIAVSLAHGESLWRSLNSLKISPSP